MLLFKTLITKELTLALKSTDTQSGLRLCCSHTSEDRFSRNEAHFMSIPGGLLIALPREQAAAFCKDIEKQEGYQAWIVGIVEKGNRTARIIDKPRVIEVPAKDREGELW